MDAPEATPEATPEETPAEVSATETTPEETPAEVPIPEETPEETPDEPGEPPAPASPEPAPEEDEAPAAAAEPEAGETPSEAALRGDIAAAVVDYSPTEFHCESKGTVASCEGCEEQECRSPASAVTNTDPNDDRWWNPVAHVPNTDDISITLDAGEEPGAVTVKAVRWANFGDTIHDPKTIKVESADHLHGPWVEDAVLDVASLQGSKEEKCLPLPEAVTARYFRLSPGGIQWQSIPRVIALCVSDDCMPVPAEAAAETPEETPAEDAPPAPPVEEDEEEMPESVKRLNSECGKWRDNAAGVGSKNALSATGQMKQMAYCMAQVCACVGECV